MAGSGSAPMCRRVGEGGPGARSGDRGGLRLVLGRGPVACPVSGDPGAQGSGPCPRWRVRGGDRRRVAVLPAVEAVLVARADTPPPGVTLAAALHPVAHRGRAAVPSRRWG